jgi:hypothetical protein
VKKIEIIFGEEYVVSEIYGDTLYINSENGILDFPLLYTDEGVEIKVEFVNVPTKVNFEYDVHICNVNVNNNFIKLQITNWQKAYNPGFFRALRNLNGTSSFFPF